MDPLKQASKGVQAHYRLLVVVQQLVVKQCSSHLQTPSVRLPRLRLRQTSQSFSGNDFPGAENLKGRRRKRLIGSHDGQDTNLAVWFPVWLFTKDDPKAVSQAESIAHKSFKHPLVWDRAAL
jgi:hypothetical protein